MSFIYGTDGHPDLGTFTFRLDYADGNSVSFQVPGQTTWPELQDTFYRFLAGCGFVLPSNNVQERINDIDND